MALTQMQIQLPEALKHEAKVAAAVAGTTLTNWVADAIREKLDREKKR